MGNASGLQVGKVIVAHAIAQEWNHVAAADFVFLEAQDTFRIGANRQARGIRMGDMVTTSDW